jgi:hypothetical protein
MIIDLTVTFFPRRPGNILPVRLLAKAGETIEDARRMAFRSASRMHDDTQLIEIVSDDGVTVRELWENRDGNGRWEWAGRA